MPSINEVDRFVLHYLNDKRKYAIAIEGPWGSGKTRYIDHHLKDEVKEEQSFDLVRVSMFGIRNEDDLYSRLLSATVTSKTNGLEIDSNSLIARLVKAGAPTFANSIAGLAANKGISLTVSSRTFFDLLRSERDVIVFDDIERTADSFDELSVFGLINELVENRKIKVICVTNDISKVNKTVREKLIWKTIAFEPDPEGLVNDIYEGLNKDIAGQPVSKLITEAMQQSNCNNARALIKARPFIDLLANAPSFNNSAIAKINQQQAFIEVVDLTLRAAMKEPPQRPKEGTVVNRDWSAYGKAEKAYERFQELGLINDFFNTSKNLTQEEIDVAIDHYMYLHYPDTQSSLNMKRILEDLGQLVMGTEEQAIELVDRFSSEVQSAEYDVGDLRKIVSMAADIREIGIEGAPSTEDIIKSGKRVIDKDIQRSYDSFHKELSVWGSDFYNQDSDTAKLLDEYCVQQFQNMNKSIGKAVAEMSSEDFLNWIDDVIPRNGSTPDFSKLLATEPMAIIKHFVSEIPEEQLAISSAMKRLANYKNHELKNDRLYLSWLHSFSQSLTPLELGPVASWRRMWTIDAAQEIIDAIEARR